MLGRVGGGYSAGRASPPAADDNRWSRARGAPRRPSRSAPGAASLCGAARCGAAAFSRGLETSPGLNAGPCGLLESGAMRWMGPRPPRPTCAHRRPRPRGFVAVPAAGGAVGHAEPGGLHGGGDTNLVHGRAPRAANAPRAAHTQNHSSSRCTAVRKRSRRHRLWALLCHRALGTRSPGNTQPGGITVAPSRGTARLPHGSLGAINRIHLSSSPPARQCRCALGHGGPQGVLGLPLPVPRRHHG